ncbi:MAG TPA: glycoside hydrolase family 2 TIM barrel-domain containing protein, partial [Methylomirabilota bacterium]|nr:glycoside hydrolase family 2 TIM barrel-domain containing protein [Methylomirabilota bacterium]
MSYGPFRPAADGAPFPDDAVVASDLASIAQLGANVLRIYHVPPGRVADAAAAHGLRLLVGVPWSQHLAFLDHAATRREIRRAVARGVRALSGHPARFAWAIGNEVPPDIVRWYGRERVERFLRDLVAAARDADPGGLVTYGNFPTTEYLDLPDLDFLTFNVYLHDDYAFRRYLQRLLNVAGERPLVIGEVGFDSVRQGEATQARWLARQLRLALDLGAAGVVAYSWTDEWHTGGADIADWRFGLVSRDRRPKPAFRAVQQVYRWSGPPAPVSAPRISVVICAYNAGATIEACLASLRALRYPRFE